MKIEIQNCPFRDNEFRDNEFCPHLQLKVLKKGLVHRYECKRAEICESMKAIIENKMNEVETRGRNNEKDT